MSKLEVFRDLINQQLTAAALEIFSAVERSFAEFEEEICRSKEERARLQRLLDIVIKPEIKIPRADVQQLSLLEPAQIKEEEELWTSQEEEQLQGLQSGTTDSTFTSTSVKQDWDQEGFSECSHVDQTVKVDNREGDSLPSNTEEDNREGDSLPSNTEEQLKAESDGQDCAAPEPDSDSQPLSAGAPDCPTAQSLEEEEHEELQVFQITTVNTGTLPRENVPESKGKTIHRCQQCSKWFSRKDKLVIHMRTHTGDRPYECQRCRKCFFRKYNLIEHMKTHTGDKPYECQRCKKRFSLKGNMVKHMRIHSEGKSYDCQRCNKRFSIKGNLVKHMWIHSAEKPYRCLECSKGYSRKHDLVRHRRIHTGGKPYHCQECGKNFALHDSLEKHMRIHKGEKPKSLKSNTRCSQNGKLVIHMSTHTQERNLMNVKDGTNRLLRRVI